MIEFLFSQYKNYSNLHIFLELTGILFGISSVFFAKKNNILVYPTGIISTLIFVYLLYKWELYGDLLVNIYYTIMSVYGWYLWGLQKNNTDEYPISKTSKKEYFTALLLFLTTIAFVIAIYIFFNKFTSWTAYVDTFTTGLFFVGMWLMAKRKIENWIIWVVADLISVPLYFYKGYTFTSIQFIIFTIIAYFAYLEWKKNLMNQLKINSLRKE
jgi:nicotinamide mononucleotide transporter